MILEQLGNARPIAGQVHPYFLGLSRLEEVLSFWHRNFPDEQCTKDAILGYLVGELGIDAYVARRLSLADVAELITSKANSKAN